MSLENTPITSNTDSSGFCSICGMEAICYGLGMIRYDVPTDDPRFGKMFRCPNNPPEQDNSWQQKLRQMSNLSSLSHMGFSNFHIDLSLHTDQERESLEHALMQTQNFANDPHGWILLMGTYGCGKTHLAAAIGNICLEKGASVLFITVPDLLDHLRATFGPTSETAYDETFERLRNVPILILDDLGTENATPWATEKLYQLFNHRYTHRMPTVFTTNLELEQIDARIASRLQDYNLTRRIEVSAPDFRRLTPDNRRELHTSLAHYRHMTFNSFDAVSFMTPEERKNLEYIANRAVAYAEQPEGWLILIGNYGAGKTHLAAAVAQYREELGEEVMFLTVPDLLDYLRVTYSPTASTSFDRRFAAVRNVPLLILDDLGTENATPWAKEKLFQVLDYRYITRLPTVITSALELETMAPRIRSRLLDDRICTLLAITAESYAERRKRRKQSR